jgi:hypothetical protein
MLTWTDLIVDDIRPDQFREWLAPWTGLVTGRVAPAFLTKFGSWFLRRPDGSVEFLDAFTGSLSRAADSYESFGLSVNQQVWQERYLLSELVYQLHCVGKIPGAGQCYALAPHPGFGGPNPSNGDAVDPQFVQILDIGVWQSICAQALLR